MKKTTKLSYYKSSADVRIDMEITRIYGYENTEISLDGDKFQRQEFQDMVWADVKITGSYYGDCHFSGNPISIGKDNIMRGMQIRVSKDKTTRYSQRKPAFIVLEDEWVKEIESVCEEKLTDDPNPKEEQERNELEAEIADIKKAVSENRILPSAKLQAKRKEYRMGMLEGGEGYNPYDDYVSQEHLDDMKSRYPDYFTSFNEFSVSFWHTAIDMYSEEEVREKVVPEIIGKAKEKGVTVTVNAILYNWGGWVMGYKSYYKDEKNGYCLYTPCGDNPFRVDICPLTGEDWQTTARV